MKRRYLLTALLLAGAAAQANVAEHSQRAQIAGIDLITYHTDVKDVVVILGTLPAGDAMAGSGNIAIPTLAGMMLDRGTKALDKFAIAEQLDNVGAEIAFSVGTQGVDFRAKSLKKDMPLIVGLIAAELRTPALGRRIQQGETAVHRRAASLGAEHRGAGAGGVQPRRIPPGASESASHGDRVRGRGEGRHPG